MKPFLRFIEHIGGVTRLGGAILLCALRPPWEFRRIMDEMDELGVRSLSIVNLTAIFTGMVLAVQISYSLRQFGATTLVPDIVSLSMMRELGPVLTALMVGGRVGAGITAELGSMKVTEQVDAVRALGADPIRKLAWPKVSALFVALPALTVLAVFVGVFLGGALIAVTELQQGVEYFFQKVIGALQIRDIVTGLGKTFFFALIIAIIGCYNGLNAEGGADGVGRATTNTVVAASITILISDFFLTKIFLMTL